MPQLPPFVSKKFKIGEGEQVKYFFKLKQTCKYTLQIFGSMDTVMVVFENRNGEPEYIDGDDGSGMNFNEKVEAHMSKGREYIVRARLEYLGQAQL